MPRRRWNGVLHIGTTIFGGECGATVPGCRGKLLARLGKPGATGFATGDWLGAKPTASLSPLEQRMMGERIDDSPAPVGGPHSLAELGADGAPAVAPGVVGTTTTRRVAPRMRIVGRWPGRPFGRERDGEEDDQRQPSVVLFTSSPVVRPCQAVSEILDGPPGSHLLRRFSLAFWRGPVAVPGGPHAVPEVVCRVVEDVARRVRLRDADDGRV